MTRMAVIVVIVAAGVGSARSQPERAYVPPERADVPPERADVQQPTPTFRARTDTVSVNVSVKNRNVAVAGLTADDFRVFDNGILQTVERVSIEGVPIDLTLFLDTSPSFIGHVEDLKNDIRKIVPLLRAEDRIRLIAFGHEIEEVLPWTHTGQDVDLNRLRIARISSVYDGLAASLLHQPEPGRRHLIVAITDGLDYNSAVSSKRVLDISARVEGVLHLVLMRSAGSPLPNAPMPAMMRGPDGQGEGRLEAAADRTGGRARAPLFGFNLVKAFQQVFDDFRTSYILRYTPTGVKPDGWHDLEVDVPSQPRATIRARRGYIGG